MFPTIFCFNDKNSACSIRFENTYVDLLAFTTKTVKSVTRPNCNFTPIVAASVLLGFLRCEPGFFTHKSGQGACEACKPNTYRSVHNKTECVPCPKGHYSIAGSSHPNQCKPGLGLRVWQSGVKGSLAVVKDTLNSAWNKIKEKFSRWFHDIFGASWEEFMESHPDEASRRDHFKKACNERAGKDCFNDREDDDATEETPECPWVDSPAFVRWMNKQDDFRELQRARTCQVCARAQKRCNHSQLLAISLIIRVIANHCNKTHDNLIASGMLYSWHQKKCATSVR